MKTHVVLAQGYRKRIKRHLVNAEWLGDKLGRQAEKEDDWLFDVFFGDDPEHAGKVCECCLVVSSPLGLSVALVSTVSRRVTSKVTAGNRCVSGGGEIWGSGDKKAREAGMKLRKLHEEHWNEMETIVAHAYD